MIDDYQAFHYFDQLGGLGAPSLAGEIAELLQIPRTLVGECFCFVLFLLTIISCRFSVVSCTTLALSCWHKALAAARYGK